MTSSHPRILASLEQFWFLSWFPGSCSDVQLEIGAYGEMDDNVAAAAAAGLLDDEKNDANEGGIENEDEDEEGNDGDEVSPAINNLVHAFLLAFAVPRTFSKSVPDVAWPIFVCRNLRARRAQRKGGHK